MNNFLLKGLGLFATAALLASCSPKDAKVADKTETVQAAMINIPTAKCASCEKTITAAVQKVDGVTSVTVDAKTHKADVKFTPGKTDIVKIRQSIAKAGYTADDVARDSVGYASLEECCK